MSKPYFMEDIEITQPDKLLAMLRKGPVNFMMAREAGIKKSSCVILILRKLGHKISSEMVIGVLPNGKRGRYSQYVLGEKGHVPAVVYRRGQRKDSKKDCKVGDTVIYQGRPVMVMEIIEEGRRGQRSYISACPYHPRDGKPLRSVLIPVGTDWLNM